MKKTFGVCTGCTTVIEPGPYFTRRCVKHLSDWSIHNHDAIQLVKAPSQGPVVVPFNYARHGFYGLREVSWRGSVVLPESRPHFQPGEGPKAEGLTEKKPENSDV